MKAANKILTLDGDMGNRTYDFTNYHDKNAINIVNINKSHNK